MKEKYELAWSEWSKIFKEHPILVEAPEAEDLYDAIMRYKWVLGQLEESWPPANFPLHEIVEYYDQSYRRPLESTDEATDDSSPGAEPTANVPDEVAAEAALDSTAPDNEEVDASPEVSAEDSLDIPAEPEQTAPEPSVEEPASTEADALSENPTPEEPDSLDIPE